MITPKTDNFKKLVIAWAEADEECRRTYVLWNAAKERRERLALLKNDAYGEWQMECAERNAADRNGK